MAALPGWQVFMDVDTIRPGSDFAQTITSAVGSCDALLAVVGPRWLDARNSDGDRRLDSSDDLVRLEIETALDRGIQLIPVLVDGAVPPAADELPPSIAALSGRQAIFLDNIHWASGVEELVRTLGEIEKHPRSADATGESGYALTRKRVTVVHLDIEIAAATGVSLDPEIEYSIRNRAFQEATTIAELYGGIADLGDDGSVRMLFGAAVTYEDDPTRARLAAEEAVATLGGNLPVPTAADVSVRVGIDVGDLIVKQAPSGGVSATGPAIASARALAESAAPESIHAAPGSDGSQGVRGEDREEAKAVGRENELALIELARRRSISERRPGVVTILGAPGIGKSRLVADATGGSNESAVLTGSCLPYGRNITLWPVVEMVKQAAGISENDDEETCLHRIQVLLKDAENSDQIATQIGGILNLESAPGSREETFWAVRKFVEACSGGDPLTLVFEDLHWGEPMLLELIGDMASRTAPLPILVLCTARPELIDAGTDWAIGDLETTTIFLEPLPGPLVRQLIDRHAGHLPDDIREQIADSSAGNPLFVEQLLAVVADRDEAPTGSLEIPDSMRALLAARIDGLPQGEREATRSAAIVGRVFYRGAVESISEPVRRPKVGPNLDALSRKRVISRAGTTFERDDTYQFLHMHLRDAAYEALPLRARADLHERFATWLEKSAGPRGEEYQEIIAHHLEAASQYRLQLGGRLTESEERAAAKAAALLESAGRRALARGDVRGTTGMLQRALELLPDGHASRPTLAAELFTALLESGDLDRSEALLESIASENPPPRQLTMSCFLKAHRGTLEVGDDLISQIRAATASMESTADRTGAAGGHQLLADIHMDRGGFRSAAAEIEAAIELVADHDARAETMLMTWLASALFWGPTPAAEGLSRCVFILESVGTSPAAEAKTRLIIAGFQAMLGNFDSARETFAEAVTSLEDLGLFVGAATGRQISGMLELLAGRPEEAQTELRIGFERLDEMAQDGFAVGAAIFLARALLETDSETEADAAIAYARERAPHDDRVAWAHIGLLTTSIAQLRGEEPDIATAEHAVAALQQTDDLRSRADAMCDLATLHPESSPERQRLLREASDLYMAKGVRPGVARVKRMVGG